MTETLEAPSAAKPAPVLPATDESAAVLPAGEAGSLFFADLVRAHYAWERALASPNGDAAHADRLGRACEEKLAQFRAAEGEVVQVYWCVQKPSAIALTEKRQTSFQKLVGEQQIRLHRVSNWLMPRPAQKLDDLLHDCDELAIRSAEILRGTPKRIAMRAMYEIESHVLGFLERTNGKPTEREVDQFIADERKRMKAAQACYENASDKVARMVYVSGMMAGVALLVPVGVVLALGLWIFGALNLHSSGTQTFFACLAAGALGAFVSVLSRMGSRSRFGLDPEIGRRALLALGAYRPAVGAIFGLALYFLLKNSQSAPTFAAFIVAAFLGGFSERFVKVMLHGAEGAMGGGSGAAKPKGGGHDDASVAASDPGGDGDS